MSQIKPYLFYVVCGILLVILIALSVLIKPSAAGPGGQGSVEESKQAADAKYGSVVTRNLKPRAENTLGAQGSYVPPDRQLSPESREDIEFLADNYLILQQWDDEAENIRREYRNQLGGIKDTLVSHSEVLGEAVTTQVDERRWYEQYEQQTAELVRTALAAGLIAEPATTRNRTAPTAADPGRRESLRQLLGLYTHTGGDYPEVEEHPELTARFRIAEAVVGALAEAQGEVLLNPNTLREEGEPPGNLPVVGPVPRITEWEWQAVSRADGASVPHADLIRFELVLVGPTAALVAGSAALDGIDTPILVRNASTWEGGAEERTVRRSADAERGIAYDVPATLTASLLVIDFRPLAGVDLTTVEGD